MRVLNRRRRERGGTLAVVLIVIGILIVLAIVGAFFLGRFALDVVSEQVKLDLQDNPVIIQHLGNLETVELDFKATAATPGEDDFVFDVKGTKGEGVLTAVVPDDDFEKIEQGSLRLLSGETVELFPPALDAPPSGDAGN